MHLTQLKKSNPHELELIWDDGHQSRIGLKTLRDSCPCAGCRGETVLLYSFTPSPPQTDTPGRYDLKGAEPVGNYALKLAWLDGHDHGIYTWEQLRGLCECVECSAGRLTKRRDGDS